MAFTAAVSRHPLPTHAVGEVVGAVLEEAGDRPDLTVLLVTGPFAGVLPDMARTVDETLRPHTSIAVTTPAVLTVDGAVTDEAAVVLFAADWRGRLRHGRRGLHTAVFESSRTDGGWHVRGSEDLNGAGGTMVLLTHDRRFPLDVFVEEFAERNPALTIVGGSTGRPVEPAPATLIVDGIPLENGAVGIRLPEGTPARAVVSQGTRPVGEPFVVTATRGGLLEELGGRPALDRVLEIVRSARVEDRHALARELHLGLHLTERPGPPDPADVLVRRLPGADRGTRAVAIESEIDVAVGTTVQVHARDERSPAEDLAAVLAGEEAGGGLVFVDLDRWDLGPAVADDDVGVLAAHLSRRGLAGLACHRVIGPISGRPRMHRRALSALLVDDRVSDLGRLSPPTGPD